MSPSVYAAIDSVAAELGATTSSIEDEPIPPRVALAGEHQRQNGRVAAVLGSRIGASTGAIEEGLDAVTWPGRLERIGDVLLDAAHNPDGALALAMYLRSLARPPDEVALVFGTLDDKDWAPMLDTLAPLAGRRVYVAPSGASRNAVDPAAMSGRHAGSTSPSLENALGELKSWGSLIVVAGSLVLVGQARALLLGLPRDPPVAL